MRTLFYTGSLVHGGAERHTITLMNRLAERGHECHAVYVKDDPSQLERIHIEPTGSIQCLNARRYLDMGALFRAAAHMRRIKPGVILAANSYALLYASLARRLARLDTPILATFHSTCLVGVKEKIKMQLERHFMKAAECLVFVCDAQERYWNQRDIYGRHNAVIHNGVDNHHFQSGEFEAAGEAIRQASGFTPGDYVIGMLAVLRPEKNHLQLVDTIAKLRRLGIPARALLIGDGPMRGAIEDRAVELDIAPYVVITGLQEEVRPYIAACNVVTLCSTTEALSLAAMEAMAIGKPVVHSRVGGAAELIRDGETGFLYSPGDEEALLETLVWLADPDACQRMGRAARNSMQAEFSETHMVDRYEQLLLELRADVIRKQEVRFHQQQVTDSWKVLSNQQPTRSK